MSGRSFDTAAWLQRLGLLLASVLFTLLLLEGFARVTHLGSGAFWEPHPLYGWRNIPSASGWESCYGECTVRVEINSQGLRDREIPYEKETGASRALMLGDSMTAGMQVPLEMTFSKVFEQSLSQASTDSEWEVVNGGVNAFGTDNELLFYRLEGRKYDPDLVVLVMYLANDVYNNHRELELRYGGSGHKPYFLLNESGGLELQNFPVEDTETLPIKAGSFLKKYFQLPRFLAQVLRLRAEVPGFLRPVVDIFSGQRGAVDSEPGADRSARDGDICDEEYSPQVAEAWALTKALVAQLRTEVEQDEAELMVLIIPAAPQLVPPEDGTSWYCDRANLELTGFLEAEEIPYLDLLIPFRQHVEEGGDLLYFQRDFHMNQNGHRLTGALLSDFAETAGMD